VRAIRASAAGVVAMASVAAVAQQPELVPGRGLLPKPYQRPARTAGTSPRSFTRDPSGALSRIVFTTSEDPNFNILIRDFIFPPDRQPHTIAFPSAAFLHFFGEPSEVKISGQPLTLHAGDRRAVAADNQVEVTNSGERSFLVRALIVEAK
jgi:hypothetical protein